MSKQEQFVEFKVFFGFKVVENALKTYICERTFLEKVAALLKFQEECDKTTTVWTELYGVNPSFGLTLIKSYHAEYEKTAP